MVFSRNICIIIYDRFYFEKPQKKKGVVFYEFQENRRKRNK